MTFGPAQSPLTDSNEIELLQHAADRHRNVRIDDDDDCQAEVARPLLDRGLIWRVGEMVKATNAGFDMLDRIEEAEVAEYSAQFNERLRRA
jgi:hypothetical protein